MKVIKNHIKGVGGPAEDPINYLGFEELSDLGKECLFYYGGHPHESCFENSHVPKYFFSTEEQAWDLDTTDNYVDYFDRIYTICPPSVTNRKKRTFVFFPFPESYIPKNFEKIYDVIYTGHATGNHIDEIIRTISKYNYKFVNFGGGQFVTDMNVTYDRKIELISQSKITVVHNLISNDTPQLKTRQFEAAFCKSLILCKKDRFNVIENWFEPNKEFIYFESQSELDEIIQKVINNYEDYLPIVEAAHIKAINNYTTRHFIKKFLS
jgi:hypothetical protein